MEAVKRGGLSSCPRNPGESPLCWNSAQKPLYTVSTVNREGKTMVASYAKMGRPVDPDSEASQKPWEKLGISRASFYWKKRYGDLPTEPIPVNLRRTSPRRTAKPSPS